MCVVCGCRNHADVRVDGDELMHEHVLSDGSRVRHRHSDADANANADHGAHHHSSESGHSRDHDHGHDHQDGHRRGHIHQHDEAHGQVHAHQHSLAAYRSDAPGELVTLEKQLLDKNRRIAERNRERFTDRQVVALNLMSSPGSGKTTLLVRTLLDLAGEFPMFVVEGDQETSADADRIRQTGAAAIQINTGAGCHLEAEMLERAVQQLGPARDSVVFIENVGNLVCPSLFDLGERARVVMLSVTEGDDKPLKYPHMFRSADVMIITKMDLVPHVAFDCDRAERNARSINPTIRCLRVSATQSDGLHQWYAWLRTVRYGDVGTPPGTA